MKKQNTRTNVLTQEVVNSDELLEVLKDTPLKIYFFTVGAIFLAIMIIWGCVKYLTFDEVLSFRVNSHQTQNTTLIKFQVNDKELAIIERHPDATLISTFSNRTLINYHLLSSKKVDSLHINFQQPIAVNADQTKNNIVFVSVDMNLDTDALRRVNKIEFTTGKTSLLDKIFRF